MRTLKAQQMRSSVRTVMGRPASICCQCRAEKPNEIMSSWLYPRCFRSSRMRWPSALKNLRSSVTQQFVLLHEQKHHEQNSWPHIWFSNKISVGVWAWQFLTEGERATGRHARRNVGSQQGEYPSYPWQSIWRKGRLHPLRWLHAGLRGQRKHPPADSKSAQEQKARTALGPLQLVCAPRSKILTRGRSVSSAHASVLSAHPKPSESQVEWIQETSRGG